MEIEFENNALRELYEDGKTSNKKYRLQNQVIKQFVKTVRTLENAKNIELLYNIKSLHYEKKKGNLNGMEVVWINDRYRLEFRSRLEGEEPNVITVCSLLDLSNHYQ